MKLHNTITITKPYSGKSKFEFWQKLHQGDNIQISIRLHKPGSRRGQVYTTQVHFLNLSNSHKFDCSLTEAVNYLDKIEYCELGQCLSTASYTSEGVFIKRS